MASFRLTTKVQVSGWRFLLRRVEHAIVRKDTRMFDDPLQFYSRAVSAGIIIAVLVCLGAALLAYYTGTNTLIQLRAPARLRGRILSLYVLTSIGLLPVGSLVAGTVAEAITAPRTLAIGGALTVLALVAIVLWCRDLPRLRAEPTAVAT